MGTAITAESWNVASYRVDTTKQIIGVMALEDGDTLLDVASDVTARSEEQGRRDGIACSATPQ